MDDYPRYLHCFIACTLLLIISCSTEPEKPEYALVIHGGAGSITREYMTPEKEKLCDAALNEALNVGYEILSGGGSSLDAVEAAIRVLEDSPLFNAGKGSVFTELGRNEMDASIMEGREGRAGAVAGLRHVRNPISAARAVMEKSEHVMLIGEGAERLAIESGLEVVDSSYFFTEDRWKSFQKRKEHGTVGAVAIDKYGDIAAGTSTGGMTNKMTGRVGDSPVIGAGTFARNTTCGLSATGHGEFFIRNVVCYDISALMEYQGLTLQHACQYVIREKLRKQSASAGIIGIDKNGNICMEFNTAGMFRGYVKSNGEKVVLMYD